MKNKIIILLMLIVVIAFVSFFVVQNVIKSNNVKNMNQENNSKLDVLITSAFVSDKDLAGFNLTSKPTRTVLIKIDGEKVFEKPLQYSGSKLLRESYGGFVTDIQGKNNITIDVLVEETKLQKTFNLDLSKGQFIDISGTNDSISIGQKTERVLPD